MIQPDGGFLEPEKAIHAQLALARKAAGAQIRTGETVLRGRAGGERRARDDGSRHDRSRHGHPCRRRLGHALLPKDALPLHVTRQALIWVATE